MLTDNQRFKKEYGVFANKISAVSDERVKKELEHLLKELVTEAKAIDMYHEKLFSGGRLSIDSVSTHRSSLISLRQQLSKKIEHCEKAGLIKSNQSS